MNIEEYSFGDKFTDNMGAVWELRRMNGYFVQLIALINGKLKVLMLETDSFLESIEEGNLILNK